MITPESLKPGDKVGIIAPGRKVRREEITAALETLSSWGLDVKLSPGLLSDDHGYLAAQDVTRLNDFQQMINDPEFAAIICARGGYGTTRILDKLDLQPLILKPKWIVGFSDITALHLKLNVLRIQSLHATMPIFFAKPDAFESVMTLRDSLFGNAPMISGRHNKNNQRGRAAGEVIGGNLSLIVDSLATSGDTEFDGKILIVEEIDEHLYKIDRMLTHLLRAGRLSGLRGVVVGYFSDIKDTTPGFGETLEEIILDKVGKFGYPVGFNFPIGHENPNIAWRSGSTMSLVVDEEGSRLTPIIE